ncbi:hypothetical protein ACFLW6_01820 [Chloroflexota bacterium]
MPIDRNNKIKAVATFPMINRNIKRMTAKNIQSQGEFGSLRFPIFIMLASPAICRNYKPPYNQMQTKPPKPKLDNLD